MDWKTTSSSFLCQWVLRPGSVSAWFSIDSLNKLTNVRFLAIKLRLVDHNAFPGESLRDSGKTGYWKPQCTRYNRGSICIVNLNLEHPPKLSPTPRRGLSGWMNRELIGIGLPYAPNLFPDLIDNCFESVRCGQIHLR